MTKDVEFWGDSLDVIRGFPERARRAAGYQFDRLQTGFQPDDFKPLKAVGPGVEEIRIREDGNQYRVIYVARLADAIHVLHAFEKKTQRTSKRDLDLARERLQRVQEKQRQRR